MAIKYKNIFLLLIFFIPQVSFAALPSGTTIGEFRYGEGNKTIVGSISDEQDFMVFQKITSTFFQYLPPNFNKSAEIGYAYNIKILDIGVGQLYRFSSDRVGTADDRIIWEQRITIKPYSAGAIKTPEPPKPDSGTSTNTPTTPQAQLGFKLGSTTINPLGIAGTKDCNGTYSDGLLQGLPCNGAIKDLPYLTLLAKNIVTKLLMPLVGVAFLIISLVGGIQYITSAGNTARAEAGKKTLTAGFVGLLIVVCAYIIVGLVANILGGGLR